MSETTFNYIKAENVFDNWRERVLQGTPPLLYRIGEGALAEIEVGPGLVDLFGGPPGAGKTAFTMQAVCDALRIDTNLKALVCNVETAPELLLDRQLARISGIDLTTIRNRRLDETHSERNACGMATLEAFLDRLSFLRPPLNLENVAASADDFEAKIILLDYIQRIPPPGNHTDRRGAIDAMINYLRQFADADLAVLVVAAVSRTKDSQGRTSYAGTGLSLASFRESSELEFGADNAFMLVADPNDEEEITLRHLKARHSEPKDRVLSFNRCIQRFSDPDAGSSRMLEGNKSEQLNHLWNQTQPAEEEAVV